MRHEFFNTKPIVGYCSMSASKEGVWWIHTHAEDEPCPLRPWEIHWKAKP